MAKYLEFGQIIKDDLLNGTIHMSRFIGYVMMNEGYIYLGSLYNFNRKKD